MARAVLMVAALVVLSSVYYLSWMSDALNSLLSRTGSGDYRYKLKPVSQTWQILPLYRQGYLLELNAYDQLTGGAMNVMTLQCLASTLGDKVVVVEPFVINATFGALFLGDKKAFAKANNIRLSDIYDIENWYSFTDKHQFPRFATWENFIRRAPHDLILVENPWERDCNLDAREKQYEPFFELHNFRVVSKVCLNFKRSGKLTFEEFKKLVYGNYSADSVTVVFTRFPGINNLKQLHISTTSISGTRCDKWGPIGSHMTYSSRPSKKIVQTADEYIRKYLGRDNEYISVMVRLEFTAAVATWTGETNNLHKINSCLSNVENATQAVRESHIGQQLQTTFITLDTGKFGSEVMTKRKNAAETNDIVRKFFDKLQQGNISYNTWENSFEKLSGLAGSAGIQGFVGMLQKEIAHRGRCIVQGGGGTFQMSTFSLYKRAHNRKQCYVIFDFDCQLTQQSL